ncbi:hypothetical protein [Oceanicola sp. S124]|uniref:hypothetical protein n=1 Tax=Oceanicola sp. S124 TaxID=1042378 RepID=UPI0002559677|nr:hypothetical protein [Oceanicola sp. S124]
MADTLDISVVSDSDKLKVWLYRGTSKRLVLSFWDSEEGGAPLAAFAHAASHGGRDNVLFFADPGETWLNGERLVEEIVEWASAYRRECEAQSVMALGQGMGGFMALAMPAYLEIDVALALSPLYAIPARAIPEGQGLDDLRLHNLGEVLGSHADYYLIHGEAPGEAAHLESFPLAPNLHQFVLPTGGRTVPQMLDDADLTAEVLERAFLNQPRKLRFALEPLGVYRREDALPEGGETETAGEQG